MDAPTIITLTIAVLTFIGGIVAYLKASARKAYAAERDFQHIIKNLQQQGQLLAEIDHEIGERFDSIDKRLIEFKNSIDRMGDSCRLHLGGRGDRQSY